MAIEIGKVRNVGVVGHGGVGKTSLVEALLFTAGAVTRLGKVDDGSTTTDFDPDEIKRKISINTAVAYCDWKGHRVTFVDTPGYGDFIADARAGLRVVEAAVVVVDAVAGVQVQTEKVWKFATEYGLPRAVVVNRLDRERADFYRTVDALARRLKGRLVALQIPLGEESGFRGYIDLVKLRAVTYANGKPSEGEAPGDLSERVKEYREKLVEAAAETDDDLLNRYLDEGSLGEPEMLRALRAGIAAGKLVPVLCASASRNLGSHALLDLVVDSLPSPADRGEVAGTDLKAQRPGPRRPGPPAHVTGGGHLVPDPAQDAGRRGQDLERALADRRGGPYGPPPLRPRDQAAPRRGRRQPPRRDGRGAHEAQVQRGRQPPAPTHPVQGDGQGARRGPGQVQEADGRARPVRRRLAPRRAPAARGRLRVRGRHLRRRRAAQLHPVGGEGRPRLHEEGDPGRLSDRRHASDPLRRHLPRGRLLGHGVPDRRLAGPPESVHGRAPHPARAHHERRGDLPLRRGG